MLACALAFLLVQPVPLQPPVRAPRIEVFKARRELVLYSADRPLKTYRIGLGLDPVRRKVRQGDRRTPEGSYTVCRKNPASSFYLSLGLTYPNLEDAERGRAAGLISRTQHRRIRDALARGDCPPWNTALGGELFIHGHGSGSDWTWGCVALDNEDIKELYSLITVGTPVRIHP